MAAVGIIYYYKVILFIPVAALETWRRKKMHFCFNCGK